MRIICQTMYAVVATEGYPTEARAYFDDQSHAEEYAEQLNNDEDEAGADFAVMAVWLKFDAVPQDRS